MRRFAKGVLIGMVSALAALSASAQSLRIGLAEDPDILDPTLARTFVGRIVFASLCDKLLDITPDLKIVPQLATEWSWSDDKKVLTMKLRPSVVFHDGEPFDATAAKYSIERHLKMPGSNRRSEIAAIEAVEAVDASTIRITLNTVFAPLLAQFTDRAGMMVSPKAAEASGDKFGNNPVCAGPFKFVERIAQDRIVAERFDRYWNKDQIHIQRVSYTPIPDAAVRIANLKSGSLELIERVLPPDFVGLKNDANLKTASIPQLGYYGITINVSNGPRAKENPLAKDARVREAFELSIDREALNQVVFEGLFIPGNQWVSPSSPWYAKNVPLPKRDVEKAKRLLKEAGQPNPSIDYMVPNDTQQQQVSQVVQAMAKEAGIDLRIRLTEFASSLNFGEKGEFDAFQLAWSGRTDPDGNLSNIISCTAPQNYGKYCNKDSDKEMEAARRTEAPAERMKHYEALARKTVAEDRPIIYLYHARWLWGFSKKLAGFTEYPDGLIRLTGMKLN